MKKHTFIVTLEYTGEVTPKQAQQVALNIANAIHHRSKNGGIETQEMPDPFMVSVTPFNPEKIYCVKNLLD